MTRSVTLALISAALLLPAVHAGADECDDAGKLKGNYLQRCKSWLNRNCKHSHGSSKQRCVQAAVNNALSSQERAEKRQAAASAAEGEWGVCTSEAYKQACSKVIQGRNDICGVAHSTPRISDAANDPIEKDVKLWMGRYRGYERLKGEIAAFLKRYGKCNRAPRDYRPHCRFEEYEQKACAGAEQKFKDNWAAYIKEFEQRALADQQRELGRLKRARSAPTSTANWSMDSPVRIIKAIKRINNEVSWLRYDPAYVDRVEKKLLDNQKMMQAELERKLAKVRCPVRGRGGKFYRILLKHGEATRKPGSTMKETVKRFAVTGKARRKREALRRINHEDLPATACVEQVRDGVTNCRIFQMTFRRSKPDGGRWGAWAFYSIGGGGLMSCKNLR